MVRLTRLASPDAAQVLAKLEHLNPSGSVKDRVALALVKDAEERGLLSPSSTLVEASSGNMGLSLALVARAKGYRVLVVIPETAPTERRRLLQRYGIPLHFTPSHLGMTGAHRIADSLVAGNPDFVRMDQFRNPAAVRAHRETTAPEILETTGDKVDALVVAVGTGATIIGVGEVLKAHIPSLLVVAVEPASSPLLSQGRVGHHSIPGIGADFVPPLLNQALLDEVMTVEDEEANQMSLRAAREEGLLVGISSGANLAAALRVAQRLGPGKVVVTVCPDLGERYLIYPF